MKTKGKEEDYLIIYYLFDLLVLPRLYERLCEEKANENDDDGDEADSNTAVKRHRSLTSGKINIYISHIYTVYTISSEYLDILKKFSFNISKMILKIFSVNSMSLMNNGNSVSKVFRLLYY